MECHRCPHAADIQTGKYRGVSFEETPCAQCELVEHSGHTLEYDATRESAAAPAAAGEAGVALMPVTVMTETLSLLLRLPGPVRDLVCMRHAGMRYAKIAERMGVTPAAVEMRLKRTLVRHPRLQALFRGKIAKQRTRKRHSRRAPRKNANDRETGAAGRNPVELRGLSAAKSPDRTKVL